MNFMEERIREEGRVKEGNVLKVDSFLNHQMDIDLFERMGREFKERFKDKNINKILTIEASGIGIACIAARYFGVPVVFAKKSHSINIDGDVYMAEVESFTHMRTNRVIVSKKFLNEGDRVLIIDDFLANGCALKGLIAITEAAGAEVDSSPAARLSATWATIFSRWRSLTVWTPRAARLFSENSNWGIML